MILLSFFFNNPERLIRIARILSEVRSFSLLIFHLFLFNFAGNLSSQSNESVSLDYFRLFCHYPLAVGRMVTKDVLLSWMIAPRSMPEVKIRCWRISLISEIFCIEPDFYFYYILYRKFFLYCIWVF